jgi:ribonuclease P protein component
MNHAFPKAKRLLTKEEYERVFKQPKKTKKIEMDVFFVLAAPNDKDTARLGFALSKKVLPKACMRNRVKRLFREDFRVNALALKPVDIIVLGKPGLKNSTNMEIRNNLSLLWRKINQL